MRILDPNNPGGPRGSERWGPLKITARMAEPVIYYGDGMHLDGILAYAAFRVYSRHHGNADLPHISAPWALDFDLPIKRWEAPAPDGCNQRLLIDGNMWGWHASAVQARWVCHGKAEIRKRVATDEMAEFSGAPSVTLGSGRHKASDLVFPTSMAREVWWYAYGHRKRIWALLNHVTHIGKKTAHGWGRVLEWDVQRIDDDLSVWDGDKLMRRMPASVRPHAISRMMSIRAPYHHRSRIIDCVEADQ